MKSLKRIFGALAAVALLLAPSCNPDKGADGGDATIALELSCDAITIPAEGGVMEVEVTTDAENWEVVNALSWAGAERSGSTVVIYADTNISGKVRKGSVLVVATSGSERVEKTISVEQLAAGGTSGGNGEFECPVFESLMLELCDANGDGKISEAEAALVTEINVAYTESDAENREHITSLKGIKMFKNLKHLECENNLIKTLDLSGMEKLEYVDCFYNEMTSLNVSNCPSLKWLYCYSNRLTNINISGSNNIVYFQAYKNNLTSLDVSGMPELIYFDVLLNNLREVNFSNCPKLLIAAVGTNDLISLDLSGLPALTSLGCYENNIASLDLSKLPNLEMLECYTNNLTTLDLSANSKITAVRCQNNLISEFAFENCVNLRTLDCSNNRLAGSLDLNKYKSLVNVACGGNNFTAISVDACTGIESLSCENTSISTLNVAPLSLLESLVANDCLLTTMDCSNNLKLQKLYLQGNPLTSLILATGQVIGDLKLDDHGVISYK